MSTAPGLTGRLRLYSRSPWPKVFASSPLFTPSGQHLFRHEHEVDVETLLRRFGLKKAKPSDDERRRLEAKVREIVAVLPPPVRLPYEVRFFSYRKCSTALPVSGSGATASFRRERFVRPLH